MKKLFGYLLVLGAVGCGSNVQLDEKNITAKNQSENKHILTIQNIDLDDSIIQNKEVSVYKIFPIDESKNDPSLVNFISKFKTIVKNKDKASLLKVLDKEIVVSEGGGIYGIKEFSAEWNLQTPEKSLIWESLEKILLLGGTWEEDEDGKYFNIPYTQSYKTLSKFNYEFDWYNTAVVKDSELKVFKEPKISSESTGTLSYDIVEIDPDFSHPAFSKIKTIDGKISGYVKSDNLVHSTIRTLILQKRENEWKIISFAPFD